MADDRIAHLLRRAGFGASQAELDRFGQLRYEDAVDTLVDYERLPDDVDSNIGKPGFVGTTSRGAFSPNVIIDDARQRWLFRMIHSQRPLQEKMTLFWHNHFATGYSKGAFGAFGFFEGTRYMAGKSSEDPVRIRGQVEFLRDNALGNFRDILIGMAKDVAMLIWLDGTANTKAKPQENFGRELMELFTMGVGFYTEADVYAAAKVFTGWNLRRVGGPVETMAPNIASGYYESFYNPNAHETSAKIFSFPVYPDGGKTIPERSASDGMQDGIDLITALAASPNTARYLARKLAAFFVSEIGDPDPRFVDDLARVYLESGFNMRTVVRHLLLSDSFTSVPRFSRYSWPVELVVRAIKEVGWSGFSVGDTLRPLVNMGQQLYDPPDVSGWKLGQGWFSSGASLARMNFAADFAKNQQFRLRDAARPNAPSPDSLLSYMMDRLAVKPFSDDGYAALLEYARAGEAWIGSDSQLLAKATGLVHLIVGSPEYQFV